MDSADVVPGASLLVLGGVVVCIVCAVVLHHFAQREVGWIPFLAALFGCATSFIMLGLVPFDLSQARQLAWAEAQHRSMEKALEQSSWEMLYWVSFFLAWVIYPILSGYEASAGFTLAGRVMSLRGFWCFAYFAGIAALTVLLMIGGLPAAAPWCLALANAWALVVAANLMAYGLVAVPQQLWVLSTPGTQLKRLYCSAVALDEARLSTQFELKDVIAEARAETAQRSAQFWDPSLERGFAVLQLTMEECELLHLELTNGAAPARNGNVQPASGSTPRSVEELAGPGSNLLLASKDMAPRVEYLAQLQGALKQASLEARRAACRWEELLNRSLLLEDIEESFFPSMLETSTYWTCGPMRWFCHLPIFRTIWHKLVVLWLSSFRQNLCRILGIAAGLLSAMILLSQPLILLDLSWPPPLSMVGNSALSFGAAQLLSTVAVGYLVGITHWSSFRWRLAGWHGLYGNHNTDTGSLLWCTTLLSRLVAPLCYHFLLLSGVKGTTFQALVDHMDVVPALPALNKMFACLLPCLVLAHVFKWYSQVVQIVGLDTLDFDGEDQCPESAELLGEGRRLVEIARRRRSEDRSLQLELNDRRDESRAIPLRMQIARLIEEGTLPQDWNASSPN